MTMKDTSIYQEEKSKHWLSIEKKYHKTRKNAAL